MFTGNNADQSEKDIEQFQSYLSNPKTVSKFFKTDLTSEIQFESLKNATIYFTTKFLLFFSSPKPRQKQPLLGRAGSNSNTAFAGPNVNKRQHSCKEQQSKASSNNQNKQVNQMASKKKQKFSWIFSHKMC